MYRIPLPSSGQIKRIYHISDLHIRSVDAAKRYEEYNNVFGRFISFLKERATVDTVVVITGDIFHTKNKLCPSSVDLFLSFIKRIAELMPLYMIIGNHDLRMDKPDEPDMLKPLLQFANDNILYMDKCGYYCSPGCDVGFSTIPINEMLDKGNTSGLMDNLSDTKFPSSDGFPEYIKHKVALCHVSVGWEVPIEWFGTGYDYLMLGDIHIQNINNGRMVEMDVDVTEHIYHIARYHKKSGDMMWGYSGSMIQQNFGESVRGHGFIEWDIENGVANTYNVKNDVGMVNLINHEDEWILKVTGDNKYIRINDHVKYKWFPTKLSVRYVLNGESLVCRQDLTDTLQKLGIEYDGVVKELECVHSASGLPSGNSSSMESMHGIMPSGSCGNGIDFDNINSVDSWIEYINGLDIEKLDGGWEMWLRDPTTLLIMLIDESNNTYNITLKEKIIEKNKKLQLEIDGFNQTRDVISMHSGKKKRFSILSMQWNYILCYGCNCTFDFEKLKGQVVCINGSNGAGKTSLLETICIAMFGEGFGYRTNKDYQTSIICQQKPPTAKAYTKITFLVGAEMYKINRTFSVLKNKDKLSFKDCSLECSKDGGLTFQGMLKGKTAIMAWVNEHIGSIGDILMSSMITQEFDMNFFDMSSQEQKAKIDGALSLQSIASFKKLMHEFGNSYKSILKDLEVVYADSMDSKDNSNFDQKHLDKMKTRVADLERDIKEMDERISEKRLLLTSNGVNGKIVSLGRDHIQSMLDNHKAIKAIKAIDAIESDVFHEDVEELIEKRGGLQSLFEELKEYYDPSWKYVNNLCIRSSSSRDLQVVVSELEKINSCGDEEYDQSIFELTDLENKLIVCQDNVVQLQEQWEMHLCCKPKEGEYCNIGLCLYNIGNIIENSASIIREYNAMSRMNLEIDNAYLDNMVKRYYNWVYDVESDIGSDPSNSEFYVVYEMNVNALSYIQNELDTINEKYNGMYKSRCELECMRNDLLSRISVHVKFNAVNRLYTDEDYATAIMEGENIYPWSNTTEIQKSCDDHVACKKEIEELTELLEKTNCVLKEQCEFNPDCAACMKNPLRLQLVKAQEMYNDYSARIAELEKKAMSDDEYGFLLETLETCEKIREKTMYDEYLKEKAKLESELASVDKKIKKVCQELDDLDTNKAICLKNISSAKKKIEKINAYKRQYDEVYSGLAKDIQKAKDDLEEYDRFAKIKAQYQEVVNYNYTVWVDEERALKNMIESLNQDIERYKNRIIKILEFEKKKELLEEKAYLIEIKKRDAFNCFQELDKCSKKIELLKNTDVSSYQVALEFYDDYALCEQMVVDIAELYSSYIQCKVELEQLIEMERKHGEFVIYMQRLADDVKKTSDIYKSISTIEEALSDFNTWVFKTKAVPVVCGEVNRILNMICRNHRDIALKCVFIEGSTKFHWFLQDGCNMVPFEKASGFQQFAVSLAMRIVIGQISGINSAQLFVDEGFVCFDEANLSNVPEFLKELLGGGMYVGMYDLVMIVSHLGDLKDSCGVFIGIDRDAKRGVSLLRC